MAALVTLAAAKNHLRIDTPPGDVGDADIQLKVDQATAVIVDYLKSRADDAWTDVTVPGPVQAAILLMTGRLFEHRGDEEKEDTDLWLAIERLLVRFRDPALA